MRTLSTANAGVTQLVEYLPSKQAVASSSLVPRSKWYNSAQAFKCHSGARHHNWTKNRAAPIPACAAICRSRPRPSGGICCLNKAPRTIAGYLDAGAAAGRVPGRTGDARRRGRPDAEHIEEFVADILTRAKPAIASTATGHCNSSSRAVDEGEIATSPMAKMKPPQIPEEPPPSSQMPTFPGC